MKEVNFAVIGYGNIGRRHVRFLSEMKYSRIIRVCDIKEERADEGAEVAGCSASTDFTEILADDSVEVVDLCTPSGDHAGMAIRAMEAGKHVLSEKPMALTLDEADAIIRTEKETGCKYFLVKQNRYNPPVDFLKKLIVEGSVGDLFLISSNVFWNRRKQYFDDEKWRGTLRLDGGALFTQCSHFVDIMIWMGGYPGRVDAFMTNVDHPYIETEDLGCVRMEFDNGGLGVLNYTIATYEKNMEGSIAVLGTKGSVKIGGKYLNEISEWNVEGVEEPDLPPSPPPNRYRGGYQGSMSNHDKVLNNVIEVLGKGEDIAVTSQAGRRTVEVMQAAHISALIGEKVDLPLSGDRIHFDVRDSTPFPKRSISI
jgi:UDP-N-acetyl-2-amino-2-deoxyglucuronate dehydrogenase